MVLALVVGVLCVWGRLSDANPDAKRLYDDLLSNYNRLIRPVGNNSDRLTVKMGLRLSQLIDVVSTLTYKFTLILEIVTRYRLYSINTFAMGASLKMMRYFCYYQHDYVMDVILEKQVKYMNIIV